MHLNACIQADVRYILYIIIRTGSSGRCQMSTGSIPTTIPPSVSTNSTTSKMTETATMRITPCKLVFNHMFACYRKPPLYVMRVFELVLCLYRCFIIKCLFYAVYTSPPTNAPVHSGTIAGSIMSLLGQFSPCMRSTQVMIMIPCRL